MLGVIMFTTKENTWSNIFFMIIVYQLMMNDLFVQPPEAPT